MLYCPRCKETCERLPVKISQICPKCGALRFNQCKACNGQFGSYDTAKNHLLNNSMECLPQVELSCHDCNYKHCNKDRLRTHIRRTHLNALPKHAYKCNRCTKTYQSFCAMRSHNRVCGRPKNIKCEFCDFYKTNDYSKLKTHIIGQHMMLSAAIENERDKSSSLPGLYMTLLSRYYYIKWALCISGISHQVCTLFCKSWKKNFSFLYRTRKYMILLSRRIKT